MKIVLRHIALACVPLLCGIIASWAFAMSQDTCGRLVGPLLAPKCRAVQLQYQLGFQLAGTAVGCLLAAWAGAWLELRRRRTVQAPDPN